MIIEEEDLRSVIYSLEDARDGIELSITHIPEILSSYGIPTEELLRRIQIEIDEIFIGVSKLYSAISEARNLLTE